MATPFRSPEGWRIRRAAGESGGVEAIVPGIEGEDFGPGGTPVLLATAVLAVAALMTLAPERPGAIEFIRKVKQVNPRTEIILYMYTPVPLSGVLYEQARAVCPNGFDEIEKSALPMTRKKEVAARVGSFMNCRCTCPRREYRSPRR